MATDYKQLFMDLVCTLALDRDEVDMWRSVMRATAEAEIYVPTCIHRRSEVAEFMRSEFKAKDLRRNTRSL